MSTLDYKSKRLGRNEARKLVSKIMNIHSQNVIFTRHALAELKADELTTIDALNILKSPDSRILAEGEFENGSYRYRLETKNMMVVISFLENGSGLIVVTAWDKRKSKGGN